MEPGPLTEVALLYLYAYLVEALPTGYIIGKLAKGIDFRECGSGNVGGANVAQQAGKWWLVSLSALTVVGKGSSPVLIGHFIFGLDRNSLALLLAPALAVLGHNCSVFLWFQRGRGIVVVSGILLALALLPVWALLARQPSELSWFCVGILLLDILKRLLSNGNPMPINIPRRQVSLNRLLKDRDVDNRADWVSRVPMTTNAK